MMKLPRFQVASVVAVLVAAGGSSASAQYAYPPGYGGYGWGGWYGGQAASTTGDIARGLGAFAAGAGAYNAQTAVANSINVDAAARWNTYVYNAYAEAERRRSNRVAAKNQSRNRALAEIQDRLRNNPTASDIESGDALNSALVEASNPAVSLNSTPSAGVVVPGTIIRDIPFQHAASALSASVGSLSREHAPPVLKGEAFKAEREALLKTADELRRQDEEDGKLQTATLETARDQIDALRAKVDVTLPQGTPDRRAADNYLKALRGLMKMLETPAINVLLSGVERRPDTTLADLLRFMQAFNLRFGPAQTSQQRAAYREVYPKLVKLRDDVATIVAASRPKTPPAAATPPPVEFFAGMSREDLEKKTTPPPPPPPPGGSDK
jgi:hypothetical protein